MPSQITIQFLYFIALWLNLNVNHNLLTLTCNLKIKFIVFSYLNFYLSQIIYIIQIIIIGMFHI